MMFRSNAGPRNRRTNSKKRTRKSILDVNMRAQAATQQRNSKIMKWLCVLILIGTMAAGIYWGAHEGLRRFVFENPDYVLNSLEIVTDGALSREQIIQDSGIHEGVNIFTVNISKSQQNLMRLPRVEVAEITRTLPNRITINITERKPVAWIAAKNAEDPSSDPKSFLVDRRGTLVSGKNYLPEYLHLPIIYGVPTENLEAGETVDTFELRAALELVRITAESPRMQIRSIDLSKRYCMVVSDRSRAKITFGLEKIDEQLDTLAAVMDHVDSTKREIQTVNLMVHRNIPVTFASASTEAAPSPAPAATPQKGQKNDKPESANRPGNSTLKNTVKKAQAVPSSSSIASRSKSTHEKASLSSSPKAKPRQQTVQSTKSTPPRLNPPVNSASQRFMDNMPVRRATPVNLGSTRNNG